MAEDAPQYGELKPLDSTTDQAEQRRLLAAHLAAVRDMAGRNVTESERLQAIERMVAEMREPQRKVEANARATWQPLGDEADVLARYTRPDGSIAFRGWKQAIPMPDGGTVEADRPGLLTDPYPVSRAQQKLQERLASWAMARARALRARIEPSKDPLCVGAWRTLYLEIHSYPGRVGDVLRGAVKDRGTLDNIVAQARSGAITGGTGYGLEVIAIPTMSEVLRPYDLSRRLPGLFRSQQVSTPSWKEPTVTGRARPKARGKASDPPTRFPTARFATSDTTVSVVDLTLQALVDSLFLRDGAAILGDPMGFISAWLMSGWIDGLETTILHGDTAGTHQDAVATWTLGGYYTAGDLGGSDDMIAKIKGLRALCFDASATMTSDAGGSWTSATDMATAKALLNGGWVEGALKYICGYHHYLADLTTDAGFLYNYQVGQGTMQSGQVGQYMGADVILTQFLAAEYASTGLYTGSGALDTSILVNPEAFVLYNLPAGEEEYAAAYPDAGATYIGEVHRVQFATRYVSGDVPAVTLYNI